MLRTASGLRCSAATCAAVNGAMCAYAITLDRMQSALALTRFNPQPSPLL